jgi:hypothetical protein
MVLYGLMLTLMVEAFHRGALNIVTPWYADDGAIARTPPKIATAFALLELRGPSHSYFPEPTKSICLHKPKALPAGQAHLQSLHFNHQMGHQYLGGHIGDIATRDEWLLPQINHWVQSVLAFARIAKHFSQTAYAGLTKSLQSEWLFL